MDARRSVLVLDGPTRRFDRRHFDEQLGSLLLQAERQQRRLGVLIAGADSIAWINRRWGRAAGDAVLRRFARRLFSSLLPEDQFARYDGNRFGIIRWASSAERALAFAQQLASRVAGTPFEIPGGHDAAFLTTSIGMALAGPMDDAAIIVAAAEAALRRAKAGGGNRICIA